jgi:hypothetical protein
MNINEQAKSQGMDVIRLKLGGDPMHGWLLVENYQDVLDARDGTIDQILCVGTVQTMPRWLVVNLLPVWYAKLRPQGLLAIEMPDLDRAVTLYEKGGDAPLIDTQSGPVNIGKLALFGEQWFGGVPNQYLWTVSEFVKEMNNAGFFIREASHDAKFHRKGLDMWVIGEKII